VVVFRNGADVHNHSRDCDVSALEVSSQPQAKASLMKICTLEAGVFWKRSGERRDMEEVPDLFVPQNKDGKDQVLPRCRETDTCNDEVGMLEDAMREPHLEDTKRDFSWEKEANYAFGPPST
jgi:hypothetical protein